MAGQPHPGARRVSRQLSIQKEAHTAVQARPDQLTTTERTVVQAASMTLRRFHKAMRSAVIEEYTHAAFQEKS